MPTSTEMAILYSWTDELVTYQEMVCEVLSYDRRRRDDRKHLQQILMKRLGLTDLPYSRELTFAECTRAEAHMYLRRHLTQDLALGTPLMPTVWVDAMLGSLEAFLPRHTCWFTTDHTHQEVRTIDEILTSSSRCGVPLSNATFEVVVSGVFDAGTFLFYAKNDY